MQRHTLKALAATVLVTAIAGVSATAIAQNTPAPMPPAAPASAPEAARMAEHPKAWQERLQAHHRRHLEDLKAALRLSPEQAAAWSAFVVRTEPQPPQAGALMHRRDMTTPQRLEAMQALHAEHSARMARHIDATRSFYAQLTPEQQKSFDAHTGGLRPAGMHGERRHAGKAHHGSAHGAHHGPDCGGGAMGPGPAGPRG
ncbi:MAG: Spy/CpxP family protein refolding chaperone [Hydrogenophaga sp.]